MSYLAQSSLGVQHVRMRADEAAPSSPQSWAREKAESRECIREGTTLHPPAQFLVCMPCPPPSLCLCACCTASFRSPTQPLSSSALTL